MGIFGCLFVCSLRAPCDTDILVSLVLDVIVVFLVWFTVFTHLCMFFFGAYSSVFIFCCLLFGGGLFLHLFAYLFVCFALQRSLSGLVWTGLRLMILSQRLHQRPDVCSWMFCVCVCVVNLMHQAARLSNLETGTSATTVIAYDTETSVHTMVTVHQISLRAASHQLHHVMSQTLCRHTQVLIVSTASARREQTRGMESK